MLCKFGESLLSRSTKIQNLLAEIEGHSESKGESHARVQKCLGLKIAHNPQPLNPGA